MDVQNWLFQTFFLLLLVGGNACNGQTTKIVGGPCEGCEAIHEYGSKTLTSSDTLPGFHNNQPKLRITGTVFRKDGKTPAEGVLIYIYHTNRLGVYPKRGNEKGWASRHGFIRGWVKTEKDGQYTFYSFRPAAYPSGSEPEHIHITVKEPGKNEYYIDDFLFDDDPKLSPGKRQRLENRGGSGLVKPSLENGILTIKRDIILGKNIPGYD